MKAKKYFLKVVSFLILMTHLNSESFAQDSAAGQSVIQAPAEAQNKDEKNFHIVLGIQTNSSVAKDELSDRESSTELLIGPSYSINKRYSLAAKAVVIQEQAGPKNTAISDTTLALNAVGPSIGTSVTTRGSLAGIIPTNEDSVQLARLKGGVSLSTGLNWEAGQFLTKYTVSLRRNFHEFTQNAQGSPNIEYTLTQVLSEEYSFNDILSLSVEGVYRNGWTYSRSPRQTYEFSASVNANVNKQWSVSLGFGNDGAVFKPNGVDSNIRAWDDRSSTVFAGLTFIN